MCSPSCRHLPGSFRTRALLPPLLRRAERLLYTRCLQNLDGGRGAGGQLVADEFHDCTFIFCKICGLKA